jgi:hypothetical protein
MQKIRECAARLAVIVPMTAAWSFASDALATGPPVRIDNKQTSDDPTYGYTMENPVKLGSLDKLGGPAMSHVYLQHLRDSHFKPFTFDRKGSYIGGSDGHILDNYTLVDSDGKRHDVYVDMYHPEHTPLACKAPKGMYLWRGGEGDDNNFNGRWSFSETFTAQQGDWRPWLGSMVIIQSGDTISVKFPGEPPVQGTCDPRGGTFTVRFTTNGGTQTCTYIGELLDSDTMSGTSRCDKTDGNWADSAWTAVLLSRVEVR